MKVLVFIVSLFLNVNVYAAEPLPACTTNVIFPSGYLAKVYNDLANTNGEESLLKKAIDSELSSLKIVDTHDLNGIKVEYIGRDWLVTLSYELILVGGEFTVAIQLEQDCQSGKPVFIKDEDGSIKIKVTVKD